MVAGGSILNVSRDLQSTNRICRVPAGSLLRRCSFFMIFNAIFTRVLHRLHRLRRRNHAIPHSGIAWRWMCLWIAIIDFARCTSSRPYTTSKCAANEMRGYDAALKDAHTLSHLFASGLSRQRRMTLVERKVKHSNITINFDALKWKIFFELLCAFLKIIFRNKYCEKVYIVS